MKKFLTSQFIISILFLSLSVSGQTTSYCGSDLVLCTFLPHFQNDDTSALTLYENLTWVDNNEPLYVKIYIHVIRGTHENEDGLTDGQIHKALEILQKDFDIANIYFIWDCNIIPYESDTEYHDPDGDQTHALFSQDSHDDGVDIYFYPELSSEIDNGVGSSQCIVNGSAFYIAGNYRFSPVIPLYTTSVVSHEMGHCLGLLHTHHCFHTPDHYNCRIENPPGSPDNGRIAGDFIDDTNADPGLDGEISNEDCKYHGVPIWDTNGTIYAPDVTNLMSYTNPLCMKGFSDDQIFMMRKFLHLQEDVAKNIFDFDIGIRDITVNTEWTTSSFLNGEVTVQDRITVKSGKRLTIGEGVVVKFSPLAQLIVEPGGILILNGKLTSFCNTNWKGVEVWGNSTQTQYFYSGHFYQGQVFTSSTATIENAEVAIYTSGSDVDTESGGVIIANGTLFKNNIQSVVFPAYQNFYPTGHVLKDNISFFRNCVFEVNENYHHNVTFKEFATLNGVDGIKFETCIFKNEITEAQNSWKDYGMGIHATDATFHVNRLCMPDVTSCDEEEQSVFEGLVYGIYNVGIMGLRPYSVKNSEFRDCYFGIYQSQLSGATVIVNRFNLGTVRDENLMAEQFGIFIEGATLGMDIQEDTFAKVSGNVDETFGIYSQDLGSHNNKIRRNTFSGIDFANIAEGPNRLDNGGLYYECNVNVDGTEYDFAVLEDTIPGLQGIREIQGITNQISGADQNGAGNLFYHNSSFEESDFF